MVNRFFSSSPPKGPSFSQRLNEGIGGAAQAAGQFYEQRQQQQQQQEMQAKRNQQLQELTGMDLSGLPEDMQKTALQEALKGKGKEDLFNKKQAFFKGLVSGDQDPVLQDQPSMQETSQPETGEPKQSSKAKPKKPPIYTQAQILEANAYDPSGQTARAMQQSNKSSEAQQRHEEELNLEREKQEKTDFQKDREFHTQFSKPIIENANNILASAPAKKGIMDQWERDIRSGKTSGLGNFLADKTSAEFWRNPESARSKAAGKEYFVESLRTLAPGARPNQFIEQQLVAAQPTIGRDVESGLSVLQMQRYLDDLKEKGAELELQLAEQDREKYGYGRQDIRERARKELTKYAEERQKQLAVNIRTIHEDQLDNNALADELVLEKITPGTPLTERMARIIMIKNNDDENASRREAERLGFELPRIPK